MEAISREAEAIHWGKKMIMNGEEKSPKNTPPTRIRRPRTRLGNGNVSSSSEEIEHPGSSKRDHGKGRASICHECGKSFPSDKSLFGHLRCHPERNYRGATPSSQASVETERAKAKRGRKPPPVAHSDDSEASVADILLLLAGEAAVPVPARRSDSDGNISNDEVGSSPSHKRRQKTNATELAEPGNDQRWYRCSLCPKTFPSYQALGGHTASHNKNKGASVHDAAAAAEGAPAEHGQALRGHRRGHFNEQLATAPSSPPSPPQPEECKRFEFDLNEEPRAEDGVRVL